MGCCQSVENDSMRFLKIIHVEPHTTFCKLVDHDNHAYYYYEKDKVVVPDQVIECIIKGNDTITKIISIYSNSEIQYPTMESREVTVYTFPNGSDTLIKRKDSFDFERL